MGEDMGAPPLRRPGDIPTAHATVSVLWLTTAHSNRPPMPIMFSQLACRPRMTRIEIGFSSVSSVAKIIQGVRGLPPDILGT